MKKFNILEGVFYDEPATFYPLNVSKNLLRLKEKKRSVKHFRARSWNSSNFSPICGSFDTLSPSYIYIPSRRKYLQPTTIYKWTINTEDDFMTIFNDMVDSNADLHCWSLNNSIRTIKTRWLLKEHGWGEQRNRAENEQESWLKTIKIEISKWHFKSSHASYKNWSYHLRVETYFTFSKLQLQTFLKPPVKQFSST